MAKKLSVFLGDRLVGLFEQDKFGALWFSYDESWLTSKGSVPLSRSLPLRSEKFTQNECKPFFAGLLPEETSRKLVAKTFGVSDKNDFAILEKIGAECAGAVSLLKPGEVPAPSNSYEEISESGLAKKIADVPRHPLLAGEKRVRLSLAGAQGKIALAIKDGKYLIPLDGAPSTHILKPEGPHYAGLVQNEFFCMKLAAAVGLNVAKVELGKVGEIPFLQVERYDRFRDGKGELVRVHQEDFCQALGIPPEMKYQQEGGPTLKDSFELLRATSSAAGRDVLALFDAVVFNYVIGNNDAHGKNFSFLYTAEGTVLSPLYDLVCTQAWEGLDDILAMKIGGEKTISRVAPKHWRKLFADVGLNEKAAMRRLLDNAARTRAAAQDLAKSTEGGKLVLPVVSRNSDRIRMLRWDAA